MRVPLWLVVLLCLATMGVTWWLGTRGYDFLPPEELPVVGPPEIGEVRGGRGNGTSGDGAVEVQVDSYIWKDPAGFVNLSHVVAKAQSENEK